MSGHELRAACELSRIELAVNGKGDDWNDIQRLAASGLYVVYERACIHCRFTDAVIGERRVIVEAFDTYEAADTWGNAHFHEYECLDLLGPKPPPNAHPLLPGQDDDCDENVPF